MGWLSRMTGLAGPAVVVLSVCLGTFVAVVRYTHLLDPVRNSAWNPSYAQMHTGDPPCLRSVPTPTSASVFEAASAFADAGIDQTELKDLAGAISARGKSRERSSHLREGDEEHLYLLGQNSGVFGRMVIFLKRDRLLEEVRWWSALATAPIKRTIESLPDGHRAAFEAQWARDPSVFQNSDLSNLLEQLIVTSRRLDAAQALLERQAANGEPLSLAGLPAAERDDGFGGSLEFDGRVLESRGRDRRPGGVGPDADQVRVITTSRATQQTR